MNDVFSYNIAQNADQKAFHHACSLIEAKVKNIEKQPLLQDVDGSQIQIYNTRGGRIKVVNDYEVDVVYIDSDVELNLAM